MNKITIYIILIFLFINCNYKKYEKSKFALYKKININNFSLNKDTNFLKNVNITFETDTSDIFYYNEILTNIGLSNLYFYKNADYLFRIFVQNEATNREKCKAFIFNFEKKNNAIYSNLILLGKSIQSHIKSGKFNDSIFNLKDFDSPSFKLGNSSYKGTPVYDTIKSTTKIDFNIDSVNVFLNLIDNFLNLNYTKSLDYSSIFIEINKKGKYKLYTDRSIKSNKNKELVEIHNFLKLINGLKPKDINIYSWGL